MKGKTIKLLNESIKQYFYNLEIGKYVLNGVKRTLIKTEKHDKLHNVKSCANPDSF